MTHSKGEVLPSHLTTYCSHVPTVQHRPGAALSWLAGLGWLGCGASFAGTGLTYWEGDSGRRGPKLLSFGFTAVPVYVYPCCAGGIRHICVYTYVICNADRSHEP
ncbi:hypothetical protein IWX49DRAFT_385859 [Phyllosticta citricarpa]|uniref:Uncharacterized protein n=1 Tax=Phyllosticta citricarpa TaxID=55181 RepID=A0ABR1L488_9PEZI